MTELIYVKSGRANSFKDGGTEEYKGWDGKSYFVDHRIRTKTRGKVYDRYPGDKGAVLMENARIVCCDVCPDDVQVAKPVSKSKLKTVDQHNEEAARRFAKDQEDAAKTGVRCPSCGENDEGVELLQVSPGTMLCSYPPQMAVYCPRCQYHTNLVVA